MLMPLEKIREIVLHKKSEQLEILNPGRFKDIYPAMKNYLNGKKFLCCTPDSILQDYLFSSVTAD